MINRDTTGTSAPLVDNSIKNQNITTNALRLLTVGVSAVLLSACVSSGGGGGGGEDGGGGGKGATSLGAYKYLTNPTTGYDRPDRHKFTGDKSHMGAIGMNKNVPKTLSGKGYKIGILENGDVYKNDEYNDFKTGLKYKVGSSCTYKGVTYTDIDCNYEGIDKVGTTMDPLTDHPHVVSAFMRQVAQEADILPYMGLDPQKSIMDHANDKEVLAMNFSMGRGLGQPIWVCPDGVSSCDASSAVKYGSRVDKHGTPTGVSNANDYTQHSLTDDQIETLRKGLAGFNVGGKDFYDKNYSGLKQFINDKALINSSTYNKYHDYTILVQAAGNENAKHDISVSLGYYVGGIEKLALSVASFNHSNIDAEHGKHSSFSNGCGILRTMCLAAPGNQVPYKFKFPSMGSSGATRQADGTSFSAPIVTGAFALLKQRFPPLTTREIRERILWTASHKLVGDKNLKNKSGSAVNPTIRYNHPTIAGKYKFLSNEFGHGALRIDLAVNPVGVPKYILKGVSLRDKTSIPVGEYGLYTSKAFGGGITKALSDHKVTVFDDLDAPFTTSLSAIAQRGYAPHTPNVYIQKKNDFNYQYMTLDNRVSFVPRGVSHTQAIKSGFYAVPQNQGDLLGEHLNYSGESKGVKTTLSTSLNKRNFAYTTAKKITVGGIDITPQHQVLWETGALLGTSGRGAAKFKGHSVNNFLSLDLIAKDGNTHYGLQATKGYTQVHGLQDSMVKLPKNIQTQSMNAYALHKGQHEQNTGFGIMMPLRVTHAKATLNYVTARDKRKNLTYNQTNVSLAPKGKQINYELFHSLPYQQGTLRFGGLYMHDKDHKQNNNQWQMGLSMKWDF